MGGSPMGRNIGTAVGVPATAAMLYALYQMTQNKGSQGSQQASVPRGTVPPMGVPSGTPPGYPSGLPTQTPPPQREGYS